MCRLASFCSLLCLVLSSACSPSLAYRDQSRLTVFAAVASLGGHHLATIVLDPGTYVLVVDHFAVGQTFHRSLGEVDLSIDQGDETAPGARTFSLDFGHNRPVRYVADLKGGASQARFMTGVARPAIDAAQS